MRKCLFLCLTVVLSAEAQTLEECQQTAERNYPLIKQYDLIRQTADITVENLQKAWLPQVSVSAQAAYQSSVAAWPDELKPVMQQIGVDIKGLKKEQYRVGIDVTQMLYDGGTIKKKKEIVRQQGEVQCAQTEVDVYSIRKRVNEMYFGVLMLDEQIKLNHDLQELLRGSEQKLASMVKGGTAAQSDGDNVKAERLHVAQQQTELESQKRLLLSLLSIFCGVEVKKVEKPMTTPIGATNQRPELRLFDARLRLTDTQEKLLDATLMPRLGVFAQGFYGYPGYNMFEDMMQHQWSVNGMVGARLTWNLGALYTRRNDKARLQLQRDMIQNGREVFLFNNRMEQTQQAETIRRYEQLMREDEEIIGLRKSVRQAAESKLAHGIIDVNDLLGEVNRENAARVQQSMHEIQFLKEIYDYKITMNQ